MKNLFLILLLGVSSLVLADTDVDIEVIGANAELKQNILLTLGPLEKADLQSFFFHSRIKTALKKSTHALGYYQSEFSYEVQDARLIITLTPGPAVTWGPVRIRIIGDAELIPDIQAAIAAHPFIQGQAIKHSQYDDYKQRLFDLCLFYGFQGARFQRSELRISIADNLATPVLIIDAGRRYKIASIDYSGSQLSPELLQSLEVMKRDDWYSRTATSKQYKSLLDTGYFKSVEVKPVLDHEQGLVNVEITLEDSPANQFLVGAGFGTDTGPRVTLRWTKPLVNSSGHSLYSELSLAKPMQELTARYQIPIDHPLEHFLEWGSGVQQKRVEDTESLRITTGLNLHSTHQRWQQIVGVNLENEKFQLGDEPSQQSIYFLPTASWAYSAISQGGEQGIRLLTNIQASTQDLYSDISFFRATANLKYLTPLSERQSLIARLELGVLMNDNFDLVPSSKRFFTGGDQSIRGYQFETIAPRNSSGDLIGGDRLTVASLEYRWRFKPQWAVATFVDTGRAYLKSSEDFRTGAGIGLRWMSPIGQVSVDFAVPVNDKEYDGFQIHISMGPSI